MSTGGMDIGGLSASMQFDIGDAEANIARIESRMSSLAGATKDLEASFKAGQIGFDEFSARHDLLSDKQSQLAQRQQDLAAKVQAAKMEMQAAATVTLTVSAAAEQAVATASQQAKAQAETGKAYIQASAAAVKLASDQLKEATAARAVVSNTYEAARAREQSASSASQAATAATKAAKAALDEATAVQDVAQANLAAAQAAQAANGALTKAGGGAATAASRTQGLSLALLTASRGAQDIAQAGLAAALNNVEFAAAGAAQALGYTVPQAMMLGAVAQGVGTIIYAVAQNWSSMMGAMAPGIPTPALKGVEALKEGLKDLESQIDKLQSKSRLSLVEFTQLEEDKKKAAAIKEEIKEKENVEGLKGQTQEESARGNAFTEAARVQGVDALQDAVKSHFDSQADEQGVDLGRAGVFKMLKDKGYDPTTKFDAKQVTEIGALTGMKFDVDAMVKRQDREGSDERLPSSLNQQVWNQLAEQKFLYDDKGNARTAQGMADNLLSRASKGDKDAIAQVGSIADKNFHTAEGDMSAFSGVYESESPEGKRRKANEKEDEERRKKDLKKQDEELDAAQDALDDSNETWKKYREKREKWIKEQVEALKAGDLGQAAIAGDLTEDMVRERLTEMGLDKGKVANASDDVFSRLELTKGKEIAKRVGTTGESHEQAEASLAREYREKQQKTQADLAAKVIPGLGDAIEKRLTVGTAMTGNANYAASITRDQVQAALVAAGVDKDQAARQANAAVAEGGKKVRENVAKEATDQQVKAASRKVDVFDASGLAQRLQASVGDSEAKKHTTLLEKSTQYLAQLANQTGWTPKFTTSGKS